MAAEIESKVLGAGMASMLERPEGRGVIAAVEVGSGVAVAVAAALVERPKFGRAGLAAAAKLAANPLRNREVLLFGASGVVAALEEPWGCGKLSPRLRNAIAVGFM